MNRYSITGLGLSLALLSGLSFAQQATAQQAAVEQQQAEQVTAAVRVDLSTTISGNLQQPRTLYILPWQDSIAQIRIPAPGINVAPEPIQPLDRQQFLRFIEAQSLSQQPASTASTKNN